jgi:hypothetical protein
MVSAIRNPAISAMGPGVGTDRETTSSTTGPSPVTSAEYAEPDSQDTQQSATTAETDSAPTASSQDSQQSASAAAAGGSGDPPDDSDDELTLDADEMDEEEFIEYAEENPDEFKRYIYEQNQSNPAKQFVKGLAGPAAGEVVGTVANIGSVAAAASTMGPEAAFLAASGAVAKVAATGLTGAMLTQTLGNGPRGAWNNAKTAVNDSVQSIGGAVKDTADTYLDIGGGSGDSDGTRNESEFK